ncbi:hypothetical protein [Vulcanisaeta thermophila]|uniref:hypothetical protein n=1 Tax=Vulcanisaeta thermophila TaxID=867917 RepID=UPI000853C92A|nr:hypothetical protein [Vulcanisaeta thermophila]
MRTAILGVVAVVIIAAAALGALFLYSNNYETALANAKRTIHENLTATYNVVITIQGQGPLNTPPVTGELTISHMPDFQALVVNGTLTLQSALIPMGFSVPIRMAMWRYNNEWCFSLGSIKIGNIINIGGTTIQCTPYTNITRDFVVILNESKYVGESTWNGEKTYCFQSTITTSSPGLFHTSYVINVTSLCLLGNGVPSNILVVIYPVGGAGFTGEYGVVLNATLVSYSFTFNQAEFMKITGGLLPG